ncbi:Rap1a/Tai family immunity protein [Pantoea dispersa]|uniref:Rap1a/Tai family immunity protein n=1 Tax=Pantoea dispersa TaxID=59814 RepID=UPI0013315343|nr:Rap1a/Tai family immunity protein [Pantoea dispersa]
MKEMLLGLALLSCSHFVCAYDGNDLYQWADAYKDKSSNSFNAGMYVGHINEIAEVFGGEVFCVPKNTRNGQLYDIVYLYPRDNLNDRTDSAGGIILKAPHQEYPCAT